MGATISSHTQGTSVSEHGRGKLEFTPQNEALLNDIVKQVEALVSSHPREVETILKEPFKWHSTLIPGNFGELNFGSMGFQITYAKIYKLCRSNCPFWWFKWRLGTIFSKFLVIRNWSPYH